MTGSVLRAEELDRPLAYLVREKVHELREDTQPTGPIYVLSDFRYLHERHLENFPTISIGGPGVNAVTHKWLEELPFILEVDDDWYVQMAARDTSIPRASVWGMDHAATQTAVRTFVENHLVEFLGLPVAKRAEQG